MWHNMVNTLCQMARPATQRLQGGSSRFMSLQMNLRRDRSSGKSWTWWNIPLMSPQTATACSLKRSKTPGSEAPQCWSRKEGVIEASTLELKGAVEDQTALPIMAHQVVWYVPRLR